MPDPAPQLGLFDGDPQPDAPPARSGSRAAAVRLAEFTPDHAQDLEHIAARLPQAVRLGTSSWSFPGWRGIVWQGEHTESALAKRGLAAYARHPLLTAVGIDRTFYRPIAGRDFAAYRRDVPAGFRFLVKADRALTSRTPPSVRGSRDAAPLRWLDHRWATDEVVAPAVEGLGETLGTIVFQFTPMRATPAEAPRFARDLADFLSSLPAGPAYSVEIRDRALLTGDYAQALADTGSAHCFTVHPTMPSVAQQADALAAAGLEPAAQPVIAVRWMLGRDLGYEQAKHRYAPFARLVDPDERTRRDIAELGRAALSRGAAAPGVIVIANNKAEGSAPLTIEALARELAASPAG
jgi:uncharacterized protein YecE (DUF72 family)